MSAPIGQHSNNNNSRDRWAAGLLLTTKTEKKKTLFQEIAATLVYIKNTHLHCKKMNKNRKKQKNAAERETPVVRYFLLHAPPVS